MADTITDTPVLERRRLILCFDGTGNFFQGTNSDTNIVKLYKRLERHTPGQFHYYQPGIGTYAEGESSISKRARWWAKLKSWGISKLDEAFGTSFQDHVLGGYRFIMRYYNKDDDIYIFGFSRGAYTARFLAEMIHQTGLLSRGNEEMIYFAWETFSNFQRTRGEISKTEKDKNLEKYMKKFKKTFCRPGIQVYFLGLFDCVNSVGQFEIPFFRTSYHYMACPAAKHMRHAVSIHERRVKYKPALFNVWDAEDLKEVWFPGNHGDVGGGWGRNGNQQLLSDTPLNWMIHEASTVGGSGCKFSSNIKQKKHGQEGPEIHDMLKFGHGATIFMFFFWWIIELLPIFSRLQLEHGKWVVRHFPPNFGIGRDIPKSAEFHSSVGDMFHAGIITEMPKKGGKHSLACYVPWAGRSCDEKQASEVLSQNLNYKN